VTLLATFPCLDISGDRAFVICADAQETLGNFRFFLEKLEARKTGNYEVIIGGAGDSDLVDAFELRLTKTLSSSTASTLAEFEEIAQDELLDYIQNEVAAFLRKKNTRIRFVIGARAIVTKECGCWTTKASRLKDVRKFELMGIDESIYKHLANRLYSKDMPIGQALRACLYLLTIAKATSNDVDGPASLGVLHRHALDMHDEEFIREAEEHLEELTHASDRLFVALPDIGLSAVEFEATLQDFLREAWAIRKKYVTIAGLRIAVETLSEGKKSYAPHMFPEGAAISIDPQREGEGIVVDDDPYRGLWVGGFSGDAFTQQHSGSRLRFCGKKRVVGRRVFAEVVPCKQPRSTPHASTENCISGTWLETVSATNSDDGFNHIQSKESQPDMPNTKHKSK